MTYNSGPNLTPDEMGRIVAYGWQITGANGRYSAVPTTPLTQEERGWGLLTHTESESLFDLLSVCKGQTMVRETMHRVRAMIGPHWRADDDVVSAHEDQGPRHGQLG